jgi:oxalate decarboxylase/phosphoglucose isomerase-like protein (cupin superfamily)
MVEALTPPGIDPIGHRAQSYKGICFMRELRGHPNANEWQYYPERQARMGVFAASGKRTFNFQAGDVGYKPFAMGHYELIGKRR